VCLLFSVFGQLTVRSLLITSCKTCGKKASGINMSVSCLPTRFGQSKGDARRDACRLKRIEKF
jgi:hypothetical protein